MNKLITKILCTLILMFPSERRYKYTLVGIDSYQLKDGKIINNKVGGIKLTYNKVHQVPTLLKIGKFKINLFSKNTDQQIVHFWQPLKEHYPAGGKKLPYAIGGASYRATINQWFLINKNFNDIYKEQFTVEVKDIITKTSNPTLFERLDYRIKQFYTKY